MKELRHLAIASLGVALLVTTTAAYGQYSVLYDFGNSSGDPTNPSYSGIVAQGQDGNLYSTAPQGGGNGLGAVFKITPTGIVTTLYSFDGIHGQDPHGGLMLATDGNFYGTTCAGGASGRGTIFKITSSGRLTVLHNFTGGSDGACPYAPPVQGLDGNFYGTTQDGGSSSNYGTVYKLSAGGVLTPLYEFDITHGLQPAAPLVQGIDGNFYGTTTSGGNNGSDAGVIFRITSAGKLTVLYNFDGTVHGGLPFGPLVQGNDGKFYGTTGSSSGPTGVIFKITPAGSLTLLHTMNGTTDGEFPYAGLVQASDGNLYGVNSAGGSNGAGTIFKITKQGSYSVLYNFESTTGSTPEVTPLQLTTGAVYGDTSAGGTGSVSPCAIGQCGVFYRLSAGLPAFVSLLPYSGKVGDNIEFLGQGFTSTSTVSFNGTGATPSLMSGTYLTAAVPSGATTGFVTVTTSSGTVKSNKIFRVIPKIKSFAPASGVVGTVVTITGISLTQTTKVTLGSAAASFSRVSDTTVTATVPSGAATAKIILTTLGGKAVSSRTFTVF